MATKKLSGMDRLFVPKDATPEAKPTTQAAPEPEKVSAQQPETKRISLYVQPEGHKSLKLYALESGNTMHDLILEALDEWANKRGVKTRFKVDKPKS